MDESNAAVIVGHDVELWSISRTRTGFSCLRTVYIAAAAGARAAVAAARAGTEQDDTALSNTILDSLQLSSPTISKAGSFLRAPPAMLFFVGDHVNDGALVRRAQRFVYDLGPVSVS